MISQRVLFTAWINDMDACNTKKTHARLSVNMIALEATDSAGQLLLGHAHNCRATIDGE